jgi:hypothetical protein
MGNSPDEMGIQTIQPGKTLQGLQTLEGLDPNINIRINQNPREQYAN